MTDRREQEEGSGRGKPTDGDVRSHDKVRTKRKVKYVRERYRHKSESRR